MGAFYFEMPAGSRSALLASFTPPTCCSLAVATFSVVSSPRSSSRLLGSEPHFQVKQVKAFYRTRRWFPVGRSGTGAAGAAGPWRRDKWVEAGWAHLWAQRGLGIKEAIFSPQTPEQHHYELLLGARTHYRTDVENKIKLHSKESLIDD